MGGAGAGAWAEKKLDTALSLADDGEFAEYLSPLTTVLRC